MKNLLITTVLANTGTDMCIMAPCRGTVHSVSIVSPDVMIPAGTLTVSRGTDTVNLATVPGGGGAAGVVVTGVPDATNKGLIFDPDSLVDAEKVILAVSTGALGSVDPVCIEIVFDDSAYVEQAASEA